MSGRTGETCPQGGVYRCSAHPDSVVTLERGDRFPTCPEFGGHMTTWMLKLEG